MNKNRRIATLLTALLMAFLLSCNGGEKPAATTDSAKTVDAGQSSYGFQKNSKKLQIGFITVGPVSDFGYNYQHNQGRLALEAAMRDRVNTVLAENVPETAAVERVMQRMIDDGAQLIVATSYGYLDSALRVAQKNPNVTFMHCLGTKNAPNLGTYSTDIWEASYVSGIVAAMSSKKNPKFGFVGAHPIPPIYWTLNAFVLGGQSVNPAFSVDVVYTDSWNNPAAESEAVRSLATHGVAGVYILVDSPIAGVQAAERAGIYSLAHHADLSGFAPKGWLTGSMWGWSKLYEDTATAVINHTWKNDHLSGGFKQGYVKIAPFGPAVDGPTQLRARATIEEIASGKRNVFQGPIVDNTGKQRVPAGQALTVSQILSLDWAVKGVNEAAHK
jgi:basic membrane protein A